MEDFTLRCIWELFSLGRALNLSVSIDEQYINIGTFKYCHAAGRLDEQLLRSIQMGAAYYHKELYPDLEEYRNKREMK